MRGGGRGGERNAGVINLCFNKIGMVKVQIPIEIQIPYSPSCSARKVSHTTINQMTTLTSESLVI